MEWLEVGTTKPFHGRQLLGIVQEIERINNRDKRKEVREYYDD